MPHLTLLDKGTHKSYRVESGDAVVGRDPASTIYVDGEAAKTVSGRHARFFLTDSKWYVEDAGSRNGTFIGTRKLESGARHALSSGDVIGLGLTGTQLLVQEAVGRNFAATMLEPPPSPTAELPPGTLLRRGEAPSDSQPSDNAGPPQEARFVIAAKGGARLTAQSDRISIGRALECLIRIEGEAATSVSRLHAEVVSANGQVILRDTGSRHGTFVNGKKIDAPVVLKRGDQITFGPIGQTFSVEEVAVVAAGSTPTVSRASAVRNQADAYQSELPTPALPRSAVRTDDKPPSKVQPTPPRGNPAGPGASRSVPPDVLPMAPPRRKNRVRIALGAAAALTILTLVGVVAYTSGQSSRSGSVSTSGLTQQSATDTQELTRASLEAAAARASLDSATTAIGQTPDTTARAALDSLRRSVQAADERLKRAAGHTR